MEMSYNKILGKKKLLVVTLSIFEIYIIAILRKSTIS